MPVSIDGTGIVRSSSSVAFSLTKIVSNAGRYTRQVYTQVDSTSFSSITTSWQLGPSFTDVGDFRAGSLVKLFYHMPVRNDDSSWGGLYIEPQYRINSGAWLSLGSSGYGAAMTLATGDIEHYNNMILIDPAQTSTFTIGFRFYVRTYSGTNGRINVDHDVNLISGTATLATGNNGLQHYAHIIVEEMAILRGDS